MKIRVTGKEEKIARLVDILSGVDRIDVLEVSTFYPNRGKSKLGRVYVELEVQ